MTDILGRLSSMVALVTGIAFALGVFHEFGLNLPFGLVFWTYYQFSDFVNLTVHWLPISALLIILAFIFPTFVILPTVSAYRANRMKEVETSGPSPVRKMSSRKVRILEIALDFAFSSSVLLLLVMSTRLSWLVYPGEDSKPTAIEDIWFFIACVGGASFFASLIGLRRMWNTDARKIAIIVSVSVNVCVASVGVGAGDAVAYFQNKAGFVHIVSSTANLTGDYQIVRKLDYGFVVIRRVSQASDSGFRTSEIIILRNDVVVSVSAPIIVRPVK